MFKNMDLTFVERLVNRCFHKNGPGRPPRKPIGVFKAHLVKRFLRIKSLRELERRLWGDERLRAICDIEGSEPAYGRTILSRFNQRLGARRLKRIVNKQVKKLIRICKVKTRTIALDATFIKAYSRRSKDNRRGYSDPESRVGRAYRAYGLGYKLHMAVDATSGLPLTFIIAPANVNEKRLSVRLLNVTIKTIGATIRQLTADSQYSSSKLRAHAKRYGIRTAIPYPTNQKRDSECILRVASDFKIYGPESLVRIYRRRSMVELVFAWLKEHLGLNDHRVRGLANMTIHASYCILCLLYAMEASHNAEKDSKARSITYWAN